MLRKFKKLFCKKTVFASRGENVVILDGNQFSDSSKISIDKNVYIGGNNVFISGGVFQ